MSATAWTGRQQILSLSSGRRRPGWAYHPLYLYKELASVYRWRLRRRTAQQTPRSNLRREERRNE